MEGLLDSLLRDILTRVGGVDVCVTEFVRISGSLLPKRCFQRIAPELQAGSLTPAGVPVRVQLLGSDPHFMAVNAARLAALKPAAIDLNFGCPAKTVNRHEGGAILLREPERIGRLVQAVREAMPAGLDLTAKMRLGYEDKHLAIDCARAMAAGGAAELVVHARTKTEGYRPPAHWEWIGRIQAEVKIPVIANGEIWTVEDYWRCRKISGVEDVMLGRGMVANPGLANLIKQGEGIGWDELLPLLLEFWTLTALHLQPKNRCGRIKQWLNYLRRTYPEAEAAFQSLRTVNTAEEMEKRLLILT
jgi:tRNA-dihydrouridine synthase C